MRLLLPKRLFRLVRTVLVRQTVLLRLHSGLQTASTLVEQGVVLGLMFVTTLLSALTLIEANAERVLRVELGGNAENI